MSDTPTSQYSFDKINYILRPRKQIERKILIEALQRIPAIDMFKYIGMGSVYYYDFMLFYKYLNIQQMISIDDKPLPKRFYFNRPFDFVDFRNTDTTTFLEDYAFDGKAIIWFDYDSVLFDHRAGKLDALILNDIDLIVSGVKERTIFIITVNARPPIKKSQWAAFFKATKSFNLKEQMPADEDFADEREMLQHNFPYIVQDLLLNHIENSQRFRPLMFQKLLSFSYSDGAAMYTLAGVFDTRGELESLLPLLGDLPFLSTDRGQITDIDVPILTYREKLHLDERLAELRTGVEQNPDTENLQQLIDSLKFEIQPYSQLRNYVEFSRYYPQYFEGLV